MGHCDVARGAVEHQFRVPQVAGPLEQASVVVLHPLVEEKVKEQLEAAKPEPIIEEVVSAWWAVPTAPVAPFSSPIRPPLPTLLAASFSPFHLPTFPLPFSLPSFLPFSYLCPLSSDFLWGWPLWP